MIWHQKRRKIQQRKIFNRKKSMEKTFHWEKISTDKKIHFQRGEVLASWADLRFWEKLQQKHFDPDHPHLLPPRNWYIWTTVYFNCFGRQFHQNILPWSAPKHPFLAMPWFKADKSWKMARCDRHAAAHFFSLPILQEKLLWRCKQCFWPKKLQVDIDRIYIWCTFS